MLTLFSSFKPFRGHAGVIQKNAVRSWARLEPRPEMLFFDDAPGTVEMAREVGAQHVPEVRRSRHGVPLVSDMFLRAAERAANEVLCYVNGDILLGQDLVEAIRCISFGEYMLVGRRTELQVDQELEFAGDGWSRLSRRADAEGWLQAEYAIDYFVLSRHLVSRLELPDLAVGRPRWDNWLLYRVRALRVPLVDLSEVVRVIHQAHDYSHLGGGIAEYRAQGRENLALVGGKVKLFEIGDATHRLTKRGLVRNRAAPLSRRIQASAALYPWGARPLRLLLRVLRATGLAQ